MNLLITKLDTSNLGNMAISEQMLPLCPTDSTCVWGRPPDLHSFVIERLPRDPEGAVSTFRRWVHRLLVARRLASHLPTAGLPTEEQPRFHLRDEAETHPPRWRRYMSRGKRRALRFLPAGPRYIKRAMLLSNFESVSYSGAGEVGDYDPFLRQAIELELCLQLGLRVYAVNQSVVVRDPRLVAIVRSLYPRFSGLVVRGELTKRDLISYGVDASRITVAPDTAWRTPAVPGPRRPGVIGLTINGENARLEEWATITERLLALGHRIVFLTNDLGYDLEIGRTLATRFGVDLAPPARDCPTYMASLAGLDFVVTERLHTAVFACIQHVPVICVERGQHKTHEVLATFGYPIGAIDRTGGWVEQVVDAAKAVSGRRDELVALLEREVPRMRAAAALNARWLADSPGGGVDGTQG